MRSTLHPASILRTCHTRLPLSNPARTRGLDRRRGWREQGEQKKKKRMDRGRVLFGRKLTTRRKAQRTNDAITHIHPKARIRRVIPDLYSSFYRRRSVAWERICPRASRALSEEQVRNFDFRIPRLLVRH
jgi:hypothetical protein